MGKNGSIQKDKGDDSLGIFQDCAIEEMKLAVAIQSKLPYFEPPMWLVNTGSCLGQLYLDYLLYEEAESAFRFDLTSYPKNGWSLKGLQLAYEGQGKWKEAKTIENEFQRQWKHADADLKVACF